MHTSREWRKKDCFTNQDNRKRLLRENTQGSKQRKINKYKNTELDKACIQTNAPSYRGGHTDGWTKQSVRCASRLINVEKNITPGHG